MTTKICSYSLLAAAAFVFAACSSVKTKVDAGPLSARTFSFVSPPKTAPAYADKRAQVHAMIQEAITKNLAAKGVKAVTAGGDISVAYLVIAGNNATTTSLNDYFGYSSDASALVDKIHNEQAVKGQTRGYFESGTLVIDILDAKTSKILKRATVQSEILRNIPPDVRQARLQGLVDKALSDLRISS